MFGRGYCYFYCPIWGMSLREFVEHIDFLSGILNFWRIENDIAYSQIVRRVTRHFRILPLTDRLPEEELWIEC